MARKSRHFGQTRAHESRHLSYKNTRECLSSDGIYRSWNFAIACAWIYSSNRRISRFCESEHTYTREPCKVRSFTLRVPVASHTRACMMVYYVFQPDDSHTLVYMEVTLAIANRGEAIACLFFFSRII